MPQGPFVAPVNDFVLLLTTILEWSESGLQAQVHTFKSFNVQQYSGLKTGSLKTIALYYKDEILLLVYK